MSLSKDLIKWFNGVFPVGSVAEFPIYDRPVRAVKLPGAKYQGQGCVKCQPEGSHVFYDVHKIKSPNHGDCPYSFGDAVEYYYNNTDESVFLRVDGGNAKVAYIATNGNVWRVAMGHIRPKANRETKKAPW